MGDLTHLMEMRHTMKHYTTIHVHGDVVEVTSHLGYNISNGKAPPAKVNCILPWLQAHPE